MSLLDFVALLVDFGLVILIWMVQLIVYPSFVYYSKNELIIWHKKYTYNIAIIVIPLMLGQLLFGIYQAFLDPNLLSAIYLFTVVLLWFITLLKFAPLHREISQGNFDQRMLRGVVHLNWIRTFLWTGLFGFQLVVYFFSD